MDKVATDWLNERYPRLIELANHYASAELGGTMYPGNMPAMNWKFARELGAEVLLLLGDFKTLCENTRTL